MNNPVYRIYYGKYADSLTEEIPPEDIIEISGFRFRMEPGIPGEPTIDDASFVIRNLDHNGEEKYPRRWFDERSRTQDEGAIVPLQLFFYIDVVDIEGRGFLGVLRDRSYSKFRSEVTVKIKEPMDLIEEGNSYMLKPFTFEESYHFDNYGGTPLPFNEFNTSGYDLNGDSINSENLFFKILNTDRYDTWEAVNFNHEYYSHRGYNTTIGLHDPTWTEIGTSGFYYDVIDTTRFTRPAFIKIGDNTILTYINEYILAKSFGGPSDKEYYYATHYAEILHADNGNYESEGGGVTLERGRFFMDDEGTNLSNGDEPNITIYDYNFGHDDNILFNREDGPFNEGDVAFYHGVTVSEDNPSEGEYTIFQTPLSYFDTLSKSIEVIIEGLYSIYYDSDPVGLFNSEKTTPFENKYCFWSDLMMYGWLDTEPTEIMVNLATQLNCYLYFNGDGEITFHERDWHDNYLPDDLPEDSFEVQLSDIEPLGDYEEDYGFDSYEIEVTDRLEINNVESDESITFHISENGIKYDASLRSTDLEVNNYRSGDLGVPNINSPADLPVFRYSPDDPNFGGGTFVNDLDEFVPTAIEQAQRFASTWNYPQILWKIQWDMAKYPEADIGKYFWVKWPPYFTTPVVEIDTNNNGVYVEGDREYVMTEGSIVEISESTSNDGIYTVFDSSYDEGEDITEILLNTNNELTDETADGELVAIKNLVYLIKDIEYDLDSLLFKMEVQEIGSYNE